MARNPWISGRNVFPARPDAGCLGTLWVDIGFCRQSAVEACAGAAGASRLPPRQAGILPEHEPPARRPVRGRSWSPEAGGLYFTPPETQEKADESGDLR